MLKQNLLFELPQQRSMKDDKTLASKTQRKSVVVSAGNSILSKIQTIVELSKSTFKDYTKGILVTDEKEFVNYIDKCIANGKVAVDTETMGLDTMNDDIVGLCLYTPGEKAIYVPITHKNHITMSLLPNQIPKSIIKEQLARLCNTKLIFHNAKFDIKIILNSIGVRLKAYWCTQLGGFCLNENEEHGLKYLYGKYVAKGKEDTSEATFSKLFKGLTFDLVPPDVAYLYASKDPLMTYELFEFQEQFLDANNPLCIKRNLTGIATIFREIEMGVLDVVIDMETTGITVDKAYANTLKEKYTAKHKEAELVVQMELEKLKPKILGFKLSDPVLGAKLSTPINLNSTTQLAILFYDILGLKSNDSDSPRGTGESILKGFDIPLGNAILDYRGYGKLLNTYIEAIPAQVNKRTGRLHGGFNQYGAKTGRFSSSEPNLQNIPSHNKDIRKMFRATEGYVLLGGDFSQQEPRVLAHMSNDEHMIQAYLDGQDIYSTLGAKVYKVPYEECKEFRADGTTNEQGKKRRTAMKGILLGIMYGRGSTSIADNLKITKEEAQGIIDDFYNAFPKVQKFVEDSQKLAKDYGYVETAYGRKRRLPDMQLPKYGITTLDGKEVPSNVFNNYFRQISNMYSNRDRANFIKKAKSEGIKIKDNGGFIAQAERQCVNSIIQGSSADITKKAMINIRNDETLKRLGFRLLLTVHDEVIGEVPKENVKEAKARLTEIMIGSADRISVPMSVDCEVTECWYGENLAI